MVKILVAIYIDIECIILWIIGRKIKKKNTKTLKESICTIV